MQEFASSFFTTEQRLDVMLGLNASLSPIPHAPVSPYVTVGIHGRQAWTRASTFNVGPTYSSWGPATDVRGDILSTLGVGLRVRLGGRAFQLELRAVQPDIGLTLGTRLPF